MTFGRRSDQVRSVDGDGQADVSRELSDSSDFALTLPQVLAERAASTPSRTAFHTVSFSANRPVATPHSYGAVFEGIRVAASDLVRLGVRSGDRVLLSTADVRSFVH